MTELQKENPDTYETWLRITSREEFNEKFRRSFISALCKFCINRKWVFVHIWFVFKILLDKWNWHVTDVILLALFWLIRRPILECKLLLSYFNIFAFYRNLFCDKNGGGFLNNSLKSRRAYQKRRRECGWQEQTATPASFLSQGSTLSSLLQSFRQQQQAIQPSPTSVAEMLRRTSSLEPSQMRSPSPLPVINTDHHHSSALADSPSAETIIKGKIMRWSLFFGRKFTVFDFEAQTTSNLIVWECESPVETCLRANRQNQISA